MPEKAGDTIKNTRQIITLKDKLNLDKIPHCNCKKYKL